MLNLQAEYDMYNTAVLDLNGEAPSDIRAFWAGMRTCMPNLASIALKYPSIPLNSVDLERSFNAYNNVVTDKRHNNTLNNTWMLVGLNFNANNVQLF